MWIVQCGSCVCIALKGGEGSKWTRVRKTRRRKACGLFWRRFLVGFLEVGRCLGEKAVDCENLAVKTRSWKTHWNEREKNDSCAVTFYAFRNYILNISLFLLSGLYYRPVSS